MPRKRRSAAPTPRVVEQTRHDVAASVARHANPDPGATLRPMSEAPKTGPIVEILVATTDRAGCKGWLIAHYAYGGGEDQPPFRGWFFWTGHDFCELDERKLLGWLPLPTLN